MNVDASECTSQVMLSGPNQLSDAGATPPFISRWPVTYDRTVRWSSRRMPSMGVSCAGGVRAMASDGTCAPNAMADRPKFRRSDGTVPFDQRNFGGSLFKIFTGRTEVRINVTFL